MTAAEWSKAPDHMVRQLAALVDELAGLDRPRPDRAPLYPAERNERVRARAREVADRIWGEAFIAGSAYGQSVASAPRVLLIDSSGGPDDVPERPTGRDPLEIDTFAKRWRPDPPDWPGSTGGGQ